MSNKCKVLTVSQVAESLQLSEQSVRAAIRKGELPSLRIGGKILVPIDGLSKILEAASDPLLRRSA